MVEFCYKDTINYDMKQFKNSTSKAAKVLEKYVKYIYPGFHTFNYPSYVIVTDYNDKNIGIMCLIRVLEKMSEKEIINVIKKNVLTEKQLYSLAEYALELDKEMTYGKIIKSMATYSQSLYNDNESLHKINDILELFRKIDQTDSQDQLYREIIDTWLETPFHIKVWFMEHSGDAFNNTFNDIIDTIGIPQDDDLSADEILKSRGYKDAFFFNLSELKSEFIDGDYYVKYFFKKDDDFINMAKSIGRYIVDTNMGYDEDKDVDIFFEGINFADPTGEARFYKTQLNTYNKYLKYVIEPLSKAPTGAIVDALRKKKITPYILNNIISSGWSYTPQFEVNVKNAIGFVSKETNQRTSREQQVELINYILRVTKKFIEQYKNDELSIGQLMQYMQHYKTTPDYIKVGLDRVPGFTLWFAKFNQILNLDDRNNADEFWEESVRFLPPILPPEYKDVPPPDYWEVRRLDGKRVLPPPM